MAELKVYCRPTLLRKILSITDADVSVILVGLMTVGINE